MLLSRRSFQRFSRASFLLLATAPLWAGPRPLRVGDARITDQPVTISKVERLLVSPNGIIDQTPAGPRDCNEAVTRTDASFGGGSYIIQAGFAESEIAAVSFTLPNAQLPIKIDRIEMIFAQLNTTVSTETQWSVLVWNGTPNQNDNIATYSSDGVTLPHIQMPIGTHATDLIFIIDPNSPEQIIVEPAPPPATTTTFSAGFRIDVHNEQIADPCITPPPNRKNAFPAVDDSGVSSLTNNWLYALNCGASGCPAGWRSFAGMGLCQPSGDWVLRVTWSSLNCTPGIGACCKTDGTCEVTTEQDCGQQNGIFHEGSPCTPGLCPEPEGACCFGTGCVLFTESECDAAAGDWSGAGSACAQSNQCPTGACCMADGSCDVMTAGACAAAEGAFRGVNVSCGAANCTQPEGACCLSNGNCVSATAGECGIIPGATFAGGGTLCPDACDPCPGDANGDNSVGNADLQAVLNGWSRSAGHPDYDPDADFDDSGTIDNADLQTVLVHWAQTCS